MIKQKINKLNKKYEQHERKSQTQTIDPSWLENGLAVSISIAVSFLKKRARHRRRAKFIQIQFTPRREKQRISGQINGPRLVINVGSLGCNSALVLSYSNMEPRPHHGLFVPSVQPQQHLVAFRLASSETSTSCLFAQSSSARRHAPTFAHAHAHTCDTTPHPSPWFDTRRTLPLEASEAAGVVAVVQDCPAATTMGMVMITMATMPSPGSQLSKQPAGTWATATQNVAPEKS